MPTGTATLDFGATPAETATVVVTGQTAIVAGSQVEAYFMLDTTASNGLDEHEQAKAMCSLICGSIVAGVGFTIKGTVLLGFATGQFTVHWVWV
jgi:hypothetical protein